jgi:hypothetical protein
MNLNEREIISFLAMTMYEKTFPNKRFKHTLEFLNKHILTDSDHFRLRGKSFSRIMKEEGFSVTNTSGEDLDKNQLVFIRKQDVTPLLKFSNTY